jgi:hypothetical protein
MWFYRSVDEPSGTYQKRGPFGSRARPIGPVVRPVGLPLWSFRPTFGGCVRVVVPFPKSINSHQTEFGWGSYTRFTEPLSATNIFWFWTSNMAMIYPFWSSRRALRNVILWFFLWSTSRLLFCRSWLGHVFGVVCLANSVVFMFSPCKSQLHQNSWKYVSVNPNKVI